MSTVCTFYAGDGISFLNLRFENDVKMYGTQTFATTKKGTQGFENDVKMYGTQTRGKPIARIILFENDVKMYGTQTHHHHLHFQARLRMM